MKDTGNKANADQGKIETWIQIPATYHAILVMNMLMTWVSVTSLISVSYVNRVKIRPIGTVSKYDLGARRTLFSILKNTFRVARVPPVTANSDRNTVAMIDTRIIDEYAVKYLD